MTTATEPAGLLHHLAAFAEVLRHSGMEAGPRRLQAAARGLEAMGISSRETVYWTLHCAFVSRREEAARFDAAFAAFWDRVAQAPPTNDEEAAPAPAEPQEDVAAGGPAADAPAASDAAAEDEDDGEGESELVEIGLSWSADERLRHVDFSTYGAEELAAARVLLGDIRRRAPRRRSRRFAAANAGRELDRRRTLRAAMRTGGHPVQRQWREHRVVARRLIFLVDVSGSMESYARALVLFAQVVLRAVRKVEVYTFGTRLTRITAKLDDLDADRALAQAGRAIPDWGGGTRIGDSLKAFNEVAGARALTRGAVVVIFSDGCERGDATLLAAQMARLRRAAHSVLWVNPHAGDARYEPRTQGMLAALPFIDVLLAGHNFAALESLAAILEEIPQRRIARSSAL